MPEFVTYRVYADGDIVHEDDFSERDSSIPYYDDYGEYSIPMELETYLMKN